ncbi:MAG: hypothetical protein WDZ31_04505 [Phycisphaeraceae bacterium]
MAMALIGGIVLCGHPGPASAEVAAEQVEAALKFLPPDRVDLDALIGDTQKMSPAPNSLRLVWWMPLEFWTVSWSQDPTIDKKEVAELVKVVQDYTVLAVVDGQVGPFGGTQFTPVDELKQRVFIRTAEGERVTPLAAQAVSPDMRNLLAAMQPMMANIIGPMGQNMAFVVFDRETDAQGKAGVGDATTLGAFVAEVGDERFEFPSPLQALLVPKVCPTCDVSFHGAYVYCPFDRTQMAHQDE